MSLQLLAKQMESKGRGGDSVLVHMTHGEVAGLQKLAESAGGSLSVNPETGLVEANFLKQMLPTIVGLAVGVGTGNPMLGAAAGAAVGGYQARRNDQDVGMGMVMGGLGGYGGASLAGGLGAAAPAAAGTAGAGMGAGAAGTVSGSVAPSAVAGTIPGTTAIGAGSQSAMLAAQNAGQMGSQMASYGSAANPVIATQAATAPTMAENFARFGQGFQGMGTEAGRAAALKSMGGSEGVMNAMQMAALPALNAADAYDTTPGPHPLLSTDLNRTGGGAFQDIRAYEPAMPRYTAQRGNVYIPTFSAAEGGEVGFFTGGGTGQGGGLLGSLVANRPFIIDPATGNVIPNPNIQRPKPKTFADMGIAGGSGEVFQAPNPDFVTPEQQAAYYAENPAMGRFTRTLQAYNPFASLQDYMDPGFTERQEALTRGAVIGGPISRTDIRGTALGDLAGSRSREMSLGRAAPNPDGSAPTIMVSDGPTSEGNASVAETYGTTVGSEQTGMLADQEAGFFAQGGLMGLAKGGMRSGGFVIPADVVSMVGEGNTDAGYKRIKSMVPGATAIKGKDGGQSDTVKTSIEGKQRARVAHGEMYVPPETVKRMGGAKKLYAMMDRVRQQATGSKKQIKPVSLKRAMA
jgi:hypothetical protein